MQLMNKILFICVLLFSLSIRAEECGFADGGYCVDKILNETIRIVNESPLEKVNLIKKEMAETGFGKLGGMILTESMVTDGSFTYTRYETFWNWMVKSTVATEKEKSAAFDEASKSGGTKIAGANLVVLAARTLQELVNLQILTLQDAQKILNDAKEGNS
ncbi:hypothetical protein K1X76_12390 [bacterium]|nr:hypothetical protein [bacterium]